MYLNTKLNSKKKIFILLTYIFALISYFFYLLTLERISPYKDYTQIIYFFNWIGIFSYIYIIVSWKITANYYFTPYLIFMSFFFLFHFGQPLMWAFGIHQQNEIGMELLYSKFSIPTDADILKAQILVITSMIMFHLGSLLSYKTKNNEQSMKANEDQSKSTFFSMYNISLLLGIISIPAQLITSFRELQYARVYGYKALYYSDFSATGSNIISFFTFMFYPSIVGLLIGSKFDKNVRKIIYIIFGIYAVLNLFSGDRGSWLYKLVILIWLIHSTYKPINFKKSIKYLSISIVFLYFVTAIVKIRDTGISLNHILESLSFKSSPIISSIFEMGGSMQPLIVLQKYGWNIYPYSNTYLLAIMGMGTNKIFDVLNIPFYLLSSFFSQQYLRLNWGAGFSIIAEALINFGPILAPLFVVFLGWFLSKIINIDMNKDYKIYPLQYFFVATSLEVLIQINRNIIHIPLKRWLYGPILFSVLIILFRKLVDKL